MDDKIKKIIITVNLLINGNEKILERVADANQWLDKMSPGEKYLVICKEKYFYHQVLTLGNEINMVDVFSNVEKLYQLADFAAENICELQGDRSKEIQDNTCRLIIDRSIKPISYEKWLILVERAEEIKMFISFKGCDLQLINEIFMESAKPENKEMFDEIKGYGITYAQYMCRRIPKCLLPDVYC